MRSPLQCRGDERVVLEALKLVKRAEPGVAVVEIDDETDRHLILLQVIEIEAALALVLLPSESGQPLPCSTRPGLP